MQNRARNRAVPLVLVSGIVLGVLLIARPATAEDVQPTSSASPSAAPIASLSPSPSASASATATASPTPTATPAPVSTPTATPLAADLIPQTIDLAFLADFAVGQVAPLSATASSGLPVAFAASGACTVTTVKGAQVARATGAGECQVTASQPGDDRYAPAEDATESFAFTQADADVTAALPGGTVLETGEPARLIVEVVGEEGDVPVPTGTVTVTVDGDSPATGDTGLPLATSAVDSTGTASITLPAVELAKLEPGDHALYVTYSGDAGYRENQASTLAIDVVPGHLGANPPPAGSPNAEFIAKYRPLRGFSYEPSPSDWKPGGSEFDSDYYNANYSQLWGPTVNGVYGRDDLGKMKQAGVNFLHIYNWNPQRTNHTPFLDYAAQNGMGVTIPIGNYTHCLIVSGCQGVSGPGSYAKAYDVIKGIFQDVYLPGANDVPHQGAAIWGIFNEIDLNGIDADEVAFVIQAILTLEDQYNVTQANRLPFFVSTSDAVEGGQRAGIVPTQQVAAALKKLALATGPTTWTGKDGQKVVLDQIPDGFWQRRMIASTNPFQDAVTYSQIIFTDWPAAFPGTDKWNTLPPMFFGEMGLNVAPNGLPQPSTSAYQGIANRDRASLACVTPAAEGAKTPAGYFLGGTMFEYSQEYKAGDPGQYAWWGARAYGAAGDARRGTLPGGGSYTIDALVDTPIWGAVTDGFRLGQAMACPGQ